LKFRDGSVGTISFNAIGDKSLPKERIEFFGENSAAVIDDFRSATFTKNGKTNRSGGSAQDKGYKGEIEAFARAVRDGSNSPVPLEDSIHTTLTTFKILESLSKGIAIEVS